jgi:hypothetical protein
MDDTKEALKSAFDNMDIKDYIDQYVEDCAFQGVYTKIEFPAIKKD